MTAPQHWRKTRIHGIACLVPTDEATEQWLGKRKDGAAVAMNPDHVRNAAHSALFWCICALVAENHETLTDREAVSDALKLLTGRFHASRIVMPDGEEFWMQRPKSISFASMPQEEFDAFFSAALNCIESTLLPGCDIEELSRDAYMRAGVSR